MSTGYKESKEKRKMPVKIYLQAKYSIEEKHCSKEALKRFKEKPYVLKIQEGVTK